MATPPAVNNGSSGQRSCQQVGAPEALQRQEKKDQGDDRHGRAGDDERVEVIGEPLSLPYKPLVPLVRNGSASLVARPSVAEVAEEAGTVT
jgi:hypothetical protein